MTTSMRVLFVAAVSLAFVSCDEMDGLGFSDSQRFKEDFHNTYPLQHGGRITLENMNGSVEISGWEKDSVDIVGTKYAATDALLKSTRIDILAGAGSVDIRTVPPSGHHGNLGAKYILRVPQKCLLDRITSSNGSIRIEGLDGSARLKTSNGAVRITRFNGPVEVQTSNGGVEINDQSGGLTIRTSNGGVRADNVRGGFEATTSNGGIHARLSDPEPQKPVKLESSNGGIELTMDRIKDNDIRITTSNSSIQLRLPANAGAQLRARTSNSSVNTDFDVTVKAGQLSKSHLEGTIGQGGPLLDLSTSNGSIKVQKI
jgi:DUF4097 and DUF4098 domain-containing protein YvlB